MASPGTSFKLFEKMSVFRQILTAVIYLHKQKAAHLNIQPGSVLVFNKWNKVKLSGFGHVIKVRPDETCQEYDLHHVAGPMEALVRMQPYNPYKADTWALGSLLFYIITGNFLHEKTNTPLPAILLPVLKECDVCHQKAILSTLTTLLFYEPNRRPELIVVLQKINDLKK
ncbi:sperm motility kinase Y-like [Liolophura sinensis]|uniref:sperm motility kinase Y-like n=1 Tax=Liolophura sinensis TaxID=3198878 RepID=UPI0031593794